MTNTNPITTRPASLTWFKRAFVASITLGMLTIPLQWAEISKIAEAEGLSSYMSQSLPFILAMQLAIAAVIYIFVSLIADEGRTIPKWLFLGFYVMGTALYAFGVPELDLKSPTHIIGLIQMVAQTLALPLLFTASARDWFAHKRAERAAKARNLDLGEATPAA